MPRLVTVSRAAKLAGVSRGNLQKHIRNGVIKSFEGMVHLQDVVEYFPVVNNKTDGILEKLEHIMNNAAIKARNPGLSVSPDIETLAARVTILSDELVDSKLEISIFYNIIDKLKTRLTRVGNDIPEANTSIRELLGWLLTEVETIADTKFSQYPILATDTFLRIMAAQVTLLPSGHEFWVEGSDSILESGLSSGLALNYGCSNGNCGKCKARILSGEVKKIRHHDYVLSEKEKLQGYILCCSHTAITDVELEADEADNVDEIPEQSITAWVRKSIPLNELFSSLNIKTPRTQRLRFLAGQTVELEISGIGSKILHVASCPCDDMNLQFHYSHASEDSFTKYLQNEIKPNDTVVIKGPSGNFVLHEDKHTPIVFIAFTTGFAPIKSLIEHALTLDVSEQIQLYWLVPTENELYMHNNCRAWTDAFEHFNYHPLCHNTTNPVALAINVINQQNKSLERHHFYIAGSDVQVLETQNALLTQGISADSIFVENV